VNNPPGGGATATTSGSTTTTQTSGNATVNQTNNTTYNYTYTYTTNNNSGGGSGGDVNVDFTPVVNAINGQTTALGSKLDDIKLEIHDDSQAIRDAINAGNNGTITGVDPGDAADVGTAVTTAAGSGADGVSTKLGRLANQMAISGSSAYVMTLAIPWTDGGTRSYSVSTMPEPGSAFDSFRLIIRATLLVIVGLAFIFACVKTFRYY
jgi:hypothetical protein